MSRMLAWWANLSALLLASSAAMAKVNAWDSADVLAVVKVEQVAANPDQVVVSTDRLIKGSMPASLVISSKEWGDDVPDPGARVLLRLNQSGDRLVVVKQRHFTPAVDHDPNPTSAAFSERVAGELSAALRAIETLVPRPQELAWRRVALVEELAEAGDAGQAELLRLHSSASGTLRLTYLGGLLQSGDTSAIAVDLPLLLSPTGLSEREEEHIGASLRAAKGIAALDAARLLQSTSAQFKFNAAYVLRDLAESKKGAFNAEVLEALVRFGLSDPDSRVRYYSACALTQATQLQSMDAFLASESKYIDFWKKWLKEGGPNAISHGAPPAAGHVRTAGPPLAK